MRFLEFFAATFAIRTRGGLTTVLRGIVGLVRRRRHAVDRGLQPVHVATWIEASTRELAAPSVKQPLTALRHLFDWLVNGQVVPVNPAHTVRGPRHVVTSGQTPMLDPSEARAMLDSIEDPCGLARSRPNRAHSLFLRAHRWRARHGGRGCLHAKPALMVRPREEGGKRHAMPCHDNLRNT
jgi:hypothetical protein